MPESQFVQFSRRPIIGRRIFPLIGPASSRRCLGDAWSQHATFSYIVAVTMTVIQRNQQMVVIPSHDLQEKYPNETRDHQNTEQQMP